MFMVTLENQGIFFKKGTSTFFEKAQTAEVPTVTNSMHEGKR